MHDEIRIKVSLKKTIDDSYEIIIGKELILSDEIKKVFPTNYFVIITDDKVYSIYKKRIQKDFDANKLNYNFVVFKNGERNKNLKTFSNISEKLLQLNADRKTVIITFGGGVVGDIGGYVAGTFMRGVPFIQVPSTLLAMVDSSIGGKVAVDLKGAKNTSGLFYQPKMVIIDVSFLESLNNEEYLNGIFEIIKHGIIQDRNYFEFIEKNEEKIKKRDKDVLLYLIKRSVEIKAQVVEKDEKESSYRQILNFGHTFGHAIEAYSKYRIKHGFAIGIGMILESKIALLNGILHKNEYERIKKLIENFGIKRKLSLDFQKILKYMVYDKKNIKEDKKQLITFILPVKIGEVIIKKYSQEEVQNFLTQLE